MFGRLVELGSCIEWVNGGNGLRSYDDGGGGGGGGRPSDALGELELFRTSTLREGENNGRLGKTELTDPDPQVGCPVVLDPVEKEAIPDDPLDQ